MSTVETKMLDLLQESNKFYGSKLTTDETIRTRLGNEIRQGMEKAFAGCRDYGEKIAFQIIGVTKDWGNIKLDTKSPLLHELQKDFDPEIQELALQIATEIRDSGALKITKKDMAAMRRKAVEKFRVNVAHEVDLLLAAETERAQAKAKEIFDRMPAMLGGDKTFDDIIAEQFTEMLAQDAKLEYQNKEEARLEAQRYARYRAEMYS